MDEEEVGVKSEKVVVMPLTEKQQLDRAKIMAEKYGRVKTLRENLKAYNAKKKAEIAAEEEEIGRLARVVNSCKEERKEGQLTFAEKTAAERGELTPKQEEAGKVSDGRQAKTH